MMSNLLRRCLFSINKSFELTRGLILREKKITFFTALNKMHINMDPMQKWLPLNYSFVHIQNSPTNLARDNKFFRIFASKTRLVGLF